MASLMLRKPHLILILWGPSPHDLPLALPSLAHPSSGKLPCLASETLVVLLIPAPPLPQTPAVIPFTTLYVQIYFTLDKGSLN